MGDAHRMQRALDLTFPKFEEMLQRREIRGNVVLLPDEELQQVPIVGKTIMDLCRRQAKPCIWSRNSLLTWNSLPTMAVSFPNDRTFILRMQKRLRFLIGSGRRQTVPGSTTMSEGCAPISSRIRRFKSWNSAIITVRYYGALALGNGEC
jgi:hypothetical protein